MFFGTQCIDALDVLCAQLTRDLSAIAKFCSTSLRFVMCSRMHSYSH